MEVAEIPVNEKERIKALYEYHILDTLPEKEFDDITRIASSICNTPISTITLIDTDRQWFKSNYGDDAKETSRDVAFCAHAINKPNEMMVVPDSRKDKRFHDNPNVIGAPNVIFYAGVPLTNPDGHALGTLCVLDSKPRELSPEQSESLKSLANQVVKLFELRKKNMMLEQTQAKLEQSNTDLEQFAYIVSHDIKAPLRNMVMLSEILNNEYADKLDSSGAELTQMLNRSSIQLRNLTEGILAYYRGDTVAKETKGDLNVSEFIEEVIGLLGTPKDFQFNYPKEKNSIKVNKIALEQIFINLLTNAIKYNDKSLGVIDVTFSQSDDFYHFTVKDNGTGIEKEYLSKIFDVFVNLGKRDRFNNRGTGIGLATVKKIIERLGGKLAVTSELGIGTIFTFTIAK